MRESTAHIAAEPVATPAVVSVGPVFDNGQLAILESIAANAPLTDILTAIVQLVESQPLPSQTDSSAERVRCSISLLEGQRRLRHGAAPSISSEYNRAIDGVEIGPTAVSCGAAAFLREPAIATDLQQHPNWVPYRELAAAAGLRACWATPIFSRQQGVLGTFATYYSQCREPSQIERGLVAAATHLAAIAIEHQQLQATLRASERRYRHLFDTTYEGLWQLGANGQTVFVNSRLCEMLGYSAAEMNLLGLRDVLPGEQPSLATEPGNRRQQEWRLVRKDGGDLWCVATITAAAFEPEQDDVLLTFIDITERKRAEARLQRLSRLYAVSSSVNEAIVRIRNPADLYPHACRIAVEQGKVNFAWIGIYNAATGRIELAGRCGGSDEYVQRVLDRVRTETTNPGPARRALRDGVVSISNDIGQDHTFHWRDAAVQLGMRSCAVLPLKVAHSTIGIMAIYADTPGYFNAEEMRVLTALAANISFAVESAEQERARQLTADALRETERMIATLFGNLPGMAYRCRNDEHWTMQIVSDGSRELTGYSQNDFRDNAVASYERVIHPQDRPVVRTQIDAAVAARRPFEIFYRIVTAQGVQKWVCERGSGVFNAQGELRFLEGFIMDITARREAEEQVAAQAALLDKAKDAIVLYGLDDTVFYWNKGAERLYGWTAAEAIGCKITQLTCRDTPARRGLLAALQQQGEWSGELTQFTKQGGEVAIEASWTLVPDDTGKPHSVLAINSDVTERKKLEAQFLTTQRLESIGTLAGGIAHDFNNILTAITGNAKLARADLPVQHELQTPLREIERAGARASDLVRQILTFSRRQDARRDVVPLQTVVAEALSLLRATLPAQIEIVTGFDADTPPVAADGTQIHQIVINLGTNAAYAMRERGGTLAVKLCAVTVGTDFATKQAGQVVIAPDPGDYACLTVRDTGSGMTAELLTRIFEPFFTTKAMGQGTGLGLAVVHGIVRSHDGGIAVASRLGSGTTFYLYFPRAAAEAIAVPTPPPDPCAGQGKRVLYVDDEEALVFLTTRVLGRLGYEVTGRTDARQALAEFRADPNRFDAVVSDLSMPGMTGPDLARELLALRPSLPIVLTSGYVREEDGNRLRELGIRDLVLKPNTVEDLGATLHKVLSAARG
jgi:two-component system, cell cycle sensor histidine kinase and response regulator CckA